MNIIETIKEHHKNGEVLKIVYNGGSQPGSVREIVVTALKEDSIRAAAIGSTLSKEFKINKIEIYDETLHKSAELYTSGKKKIKYSNYQDVIDLHSKIFNEKELTAQVEEDNFGLFGSYKNGKLKKRPEIAIEYHEFIYDDYYDPETDKFRSGKHKAQKPWCVKAKGKTTRNYKHFEKAIETFIDYAKTF